jgi:DNA replication and repair protein RecF
MLHDSRKHDHAAGRTLKGPHPADQAVTQAAPGMAARTSSTGEQKALLIGLVLAHARAVRDSFAGWAPLVLLDEVAAHLDGERRSGLYDELAGLGAQTWMTGTDQGLFGELEDRADVAVIAAGAVRQLATAASFGQVT